MSHRVVEWGVIVVAGMIALVQTAVAVGAAVVVCMVAYNLLTGHRL